MPPGATFVPRGRICDSTDNSRTLRSITLPYCTSQQALADETTPSIRRTAFVKVHTCAPASNMQTMFEPRGFFLDGLPDDVIRVPRAKAMVKIRQKGSVGYVHAIEIGHCAPPTWARLAQYASGSI